MKRYVRPMMDAQMFVANEYVAVCTDTVNKYYKFVCNGKGWFGAGGSVYEETNNVDGLQIGQDDHLTSSYHQCNITHYVKADENVDDVFSEGYFQTLGSFFNPQKVLIWKGENNDNVHVTKSLQTEIQTVTGNFS